MTKRPKILPRIVLMLLMLLIPVASLFAQGAGGPNALHNAFAGGPPPPPGGGGGGSPLAVPLDSDALILLLFAGILYLLYHYRKINSQKEVSENTEITDEKTVISN